MPSLSFDPVAHAYDATRGYPPGIDQQIAQSIAQIADATPETNFLEVGIGTGRIAFPLASLGHIYTGVDISEKMMARLISKLLANGWQGDQQLWGSLPDEDSTTDHRVRRFTSPQEHASMRLVQSDMTALPFKNDSFDVVLGVHVFHLVDNWQQALREVLRVLRAGGLFLHCGDDVISSPRLSVKGTWEEIVQQLGGEVKRPGAASHTQITDWLRQQGLQPEEIRITRWESTITLREELESVTQRLWSGTWCVSDDLFAASVERLEQWANKQFGSNMDIPYKRECQFVIDKTQVK